MRGKPSRKPSIINSQVDSSDLFGGKFETSSRQATNINILENYMDNQTGNKNDDQFDSPPSFIQTKMSVPTYLSRNELFSVVDCEELSAWSVKMRGLVSNAFPSEQEDFDPSIEFKCILGWEKHCEISKIRKIFAHHQFVALLLEHDRLNFIGNCQFFNRLLAQNFNSERIDTVDTPTTILESISLTSNGLDETLQKQEKKKRKISLFRKNDSSSPNRSPNRSPRDDSLSLSASSLLSTTKIPTKPVDTVNENYFNEMTKKETEIYSVSRMENNNFNLILKFHALKELIKKLVFGSSKHFFILTENGNVFVLGKNQDGQLGISDKYEKVETEPKAVNFNGYKIAEIIAEEYWTMFLTLEGKVFVCGRNYGFGGMYLDIPHTNLFTPYQVTLSNMHVEKMTGWMGSVIFLTREENAQFSFGLNNFGMLANGGNSLSVIGGPTRITQFWNKEIIKDIFMVNNNTVFVTATDRIYVCGLSTQRDKPECILDISTLELLERFTIKKVLDGDGYGNILLFLSIELDVYMYFFDETNEKNVFTKVLNNIVDIDSCGRNLIFLQNNFILQYNETSVNINRESLCLMKVFSHDPLFDSQKSTEWIIPPSDLIEDADIVRPLLLISKFSNQFHVGRRKRKNVNYGTSSDSIDMAIDTIHSSSTSPEMKQLWFDIVKSFSDKEQYALKYTTEYLKLELLNEILDVPMFYNQVVKDLWKLPPNPSKTERDLHLIAHSYFTYHKDKGIDQKWDNLVYFPQNEEMLFKLLVFSFELDLSTLTTGIFNYLRLKLDAKPVQSLNKLQILEYATNFPELRKNFDIWFNLRSKKKVKNPFKTKKAKGFDMFFSTTMLIILQKLMDGLAPLSVKHPGKTYRNYQPIILDLNSLQIAETWTIIKKLKDDISEMILKRQATNSKKKAIEYKELLSEYCKGIRFNDIFNSLCSQPHSINFILKFCVCNCFSADPRWKIDESKTVHILNRKMKFKMSARELVTKIDLDINQTFQKSDSTTAPPGSPEMDERIEVITEIFTSSNSQNLTKSQERTKGIETIPIHSENVDINSNKNNLLLNDKYLKTNTSEPTSPDSTNPSPDYQQALDYGKQLIFDERVPLFKVRKMAKSRFDSLTNHDLTQLYIELVKIQTEKMKH